MAEKVFDRKNAIGFWHRDGFSYEVKDMISGKRSIWKIFLADDEYEDLGLVQAYEQKYLERQVDLWNAEEEEKSKRPAMAPEQRKDLGSVLREWKASDIRRKDTLTPRYHSIQ
jgi:two-component SAPR family response regulator